MKKKVNTIASEGASAGGEVLGVAELKPVMVKLRDGYGEEMVKIALIAPDGAVYFTDEDAMKIKPAQQWVKNAVLEKLGISK